MLFLLKALVNLVQFDDIELSVVLDCLKTWASRMKAEFLQDRNPLLKSHEPVGKKEPESIAIRGEEQQRFHSSGQNSVWTEEPIGSKHACHIIFKYLLHHLKQHDTIPQILEVLYQLLPILKGTGASSRETPKQQKTFRRFFDALYEVLADYEEYEIQSSPILAHLVLFIADLLHVQSLNEKVTNSVKKFVTQRIRFICSSNWPVCCQI